MKLNKDALFYYLSAQFGGSGDITCQILMGGKVVASAHASGSYNICHAQKNAALLGF